jgi:hypothetical protein
MNSSIDTYFVDMVTSTLDDYFLHLGACRDVSSDTTVVRYSADEWFAEVLYIPTDGPKYSPRIVIGCRPEQFADPRRNRVDVMYTAPDDSEEHHYNLRWRYQSPSELESVLESVKDRILEVYTTPFLQDTDRLRKLLQQRNDIVEAEWTQEINEHNDSVWRTKAETAFRARDYENAIRHYEAIPTERRSRVDQAKLDFARGRTMAG